LSHNSIKLLKTRIKMKLIGSEKLENKGNKLIINFIKKRKVTYIIGIVFMFLSSYVQTLFPKVLGKTIDILKVKNFDMSMVKLNVLYILLIAAATFVCTYIWRNFVIGNARNLECHLREELFGHLQKMSVQFYNNHKTGNLIAYAINDINAVRMTFGPATAMSFNGVLICIISIYSMVKTVNWKLTLICLFPIPFITVFMFFVGKIVQKRFRTVQENFADISDKIQENIYGIRVIKAYSQEKDEINNFEELNIKMMDSNLAMVRISSFLSPAIEICFSISFVMNLIIGGNMVLKRQITLGEFIAFNTYLTMIIRPVIMLGKIITIFERGLASLKRLNDIFNLAPEILDGGKGLKTPLEGEIELRNLSFAYPNSSEKALEGINLTIKKGSTIGIVGKTGSGKTTLANLLLKLYNVEDGKIYLDGNDINDYCLAAIRNCAGFVPQDNFLFSASINDNITFFKEGYSSNDIKAAARSSCIYDSIMNFPYGFDTVLGERGVNISGGQKQRVSIARAVIKNPPILILDDALSAVDTITETQILKNFKEVRKGKTAIIIAHRLSSVQDADEIIVLDKGKICENGTHQELIAKGGLYYDIYREQREENKKQVS
jgi:ATP-binding cassette subfamily B multidrug efflux pump